MANMRKGPTFYLPKKGVGQPINLDEAAGYPVNSNQPQDNSNALNLGAPVQAQGLQIGGLDFGAPSNVPTDPRLAEPTPNAGGGMDYPVPVASLPLSPESQGLGLAESVPQPGDMTVSLPSVTSNPGGGSRPGFAPVDKQNPDLLPTGDFTKDHPNWTTALLALSAGVEGAAAFSQHRAPTAGPVIGRLLIEQQHLDQQAKRDKAVLEDRDLDRGIKAVAIAKDYRSGLSKIAPADQAKYKAGYTDLLKKTAPGSEKMIEFGEANPQGLDSVLSGTSPAFTKTVMGQADPMKYLGEHIKERQADLEEQGARHASTYEEAVKSTPEGAASLEAFKAAKLPEATARQHFLTVAEESGASPEKLLSIDAYLRSEKGQQHLQSLGVRLDNPKSRHEEAVASTAEDVAAQSKDVRDKVKGLDAHIDSVLKQPASPERDKYLSELQGRRDQLTKTESPEAIASKIGATKQAELTNRTPNELLKSDLDIEKAKAEIAKDQQALKNMSPEGIDYKNKQSEIAARQEQVDKSQLFHDFLGGKKLTKEEDYALNNYFSNQANRDETLKLSIERLNLDNEKTNLELIGRLTKAGVLSGANADAFTKQAIDVLAKKNGMTLQETQNWWQKMMPNWLGGGGSSMTLQPSGTGIPPAVTPKGTVQPGMPPNLNPPGQLPTLKPVQPQGPARVTGEADYNKLKSGTAYIDPRDGKTKIKK